MCAERFEKCPSAPVLATPACLAVVALEQRDEHGRAALLRGGDGRGAATRGREQVVDVRHRG